MEDDLGHKYLLLEALRCWLRRKPVDKPNVELSESNEVINRSNQVNQATGDCSWDNYNQRLLTLLVEREGEFSRSRNSVA